MLDGLFPLTIFPAGGLAHSVIVPVWIGVLVVAFFNLRFGWVLSGLVVPGYIVPMLIVNPPLAIANFLQALLTLLIAVFISNRAATLANWSHFFGRDRFFLIVIVSIFVRLILDTWGFDAASGWFSERYGKEIVFRSDLHSFGLIIIALMANQMWKTGLLRGSWHIVVTVGITFVIVRYGLMELTNFSLTNLAFMYEEVSIAILASPKSYIIILVSCYIASKMNLRYGWEYAGILVPSLLAIQWYQPFKIAATFLETFVVLLLASILLQIRVIGNMDLTGARKLMLFFTIAFGYKFILAIVFGVVAPYQKVSDFYAFGYLLSTLMAIKMHDKGLLIGMSRTILQTSLVAVFMATVIGYTLYRADIFLTDEFAKPSVETELVPVEQSGTQLMSLHSWLVAQKTAAYAGKQDIYSAGYTVSSIDHFRAAIGAILDYRDTRQNHYLQRARASLSEVGAKLAIIENQYLAVGNSSDPNFGSYIINLSANAEDLLVQAPNGFDERRSYNAALAVFSMNNAGFLAISNGFVVSGGTDLTNSNTLFNHFQMMTVRHNVVQVRTTAHDAWSKASQWSPGFDLEPGDAFVWVKQRIPDGLNINFLARVADQLQVNWFSPSFTNRQRDLSQSAFAEILLDRAAATKLFGLARLAEANLIQEESSISIEGYLQQWLLAKKLQIAEKESQSYKQPTLGEALFFLEEAALEILELIDKEHTLDGWSDDGLSKLEQINGVLRFFNYQLIQYTDVSQGDTFLILSEDFSVEAQKYWGTYVFRLNTQSQHVIEIPRPLFERRTFELGLHVFHTLRARALFIAGAHPQANTDHSADVLKLRNRYSLFSTMHYGIGVYFEDFPLQYVQIRSMPEAMQLDLPDIDVVIDADHETQVLEDSGRTFQQIMSYFETQGFAVKVGQRPVLGQSSDTAQPANHPVYSELGLNSQSAQLRYQSNKQFVVTWVTPDVRSRFRQADRLITLQSQLAVLNIDKQDVNVARLVSGMEDASIGLSEEVKHQLRWYVQRHNIVDLYNAARSDDQIQLRALRDEISQQLFLQVTKQSQTVALLNLNPTSLTERHRSDLGQDPGQEFVDGRFACLWFEVAP